MRQVLIDHWPLIVLDLHDMYGIDVSNHELMRSRTWGWLQDRISGLVNAPPIITATGHAVPATRLGWELNPPNFDEKPT